MNIAQKIFFAALDARISVNYYRLDVIAFSVVLDFQSDAHPQTTCR